MEPSSSFPFPHERLDAYRLAVEVAVEVQRLHYPRGLAWLRDQAVRASGSAVLNIAEATGRTGDARRNHFRIALGSIAEACAALDLLDVETAAVQEKCRRVGAMVNRLARR